MDKQMGILGVEPRLSPYKEPALTIKLYSHKPRSIIEDLELFVNYLLRVPYGFSLDHLLAPNNRRFCRA